MNEQTENVSNLQIKELRKTCPKCGVIRETSDANCANCGKPLQKVSTIRGLGVALVVIGGSLLAFMCWLSFWVYGMISNTGNATSGSRFNGGPNGAIFIIFTFGLVISVSLTAIAGGIWQIVFGKRNKAIVYTMIGLGIIFLIMGFGSAVALRIK